MQLLEPLQVRTRVLRCFARAGHLDPADARDMASWDHSGGFSLDASVRIERTDRAGLERLLRYCARPPFALERLDLAHLGEPTTAPRAAPARTPPLWEPMAQPQRDDIPPPALEFVFDQRLGW